ncbi:DNA-binding protein [Niastella vici]|uniref:DNA-binding protein n=1 Tax=Niastella vici TaxID=1703345 RepID=A0A1V9G6W8_9BACT|nr:glycosyl hydrolase [Niastella vici]OQP66395.1 DNA-binding protein [Niastella vici]
MKKSTIILLSCLGALLMFPHATNFPGRVALNDATRLSDTSIDELFRHPPEQAKPFVLWYWMQAAASKEGITADLEAMKSNGIGGAYMVFIKGADSVPLINPPAQQLTPHWWSLVKFAMQEAKRLNLQLGLHMSDGFALAGGPWIKPEMSMQRVVSTKIYTAGKKTFNDILPQPESNENYYRDIAVFAYPTMIKKSIADTALVPVVTSSVMGISPQFLTDKRSRQSFKSDSTCWIQYTYLKPFTCRSIVIKTGGNNYSSRRLKILVSNDGKQFHEIERMQSPRHGWQDTDADVTYAIKSTTARYFRFEYNKEGLEPGSEDLDAAKWKPVLKVNSILLYGEPVIHQYEGKSGAVWRVSERTTAAQAPDSLCVPLNRIIDLTNKMTPDGRLVWEVPDGNWTIMRIGHTSTGHTNATGGGGKGLECDKFNPEAVRLQFDSWFAAAIRQVGTETTKEVLKTFYIDSWECGSQNWSPVFRAEFKKRRGYDCLPYLIAMTGVPVQSADVSERFLYDVRQTITELVKDNFFVTLKKLAAEKGCVMTAENVAPTMTSDALLHFQVTDIPMGEFWLRSPTHDKPNDMFDAISGAHIYGKQLIQAEAFTELRMAWDEHPGLMKTLGDRNYAMGVNRLVYHVFVHNPWLNRQPGITLGGVGSFFQRDQTWWKPAKAWVEYAQRCQALLQQGKPVVDVAVFTGEEIPRRSVLPDRLVSTLPGIFGDSIVQAEKKRLTNAGNPLRAMPEGVTHTANMADPENWVDPLHGYAYDCINPDALLKAAVRNGRIELPGGASYKLLVLPQPHSLSPTAKRMTPAIAKKIAELVQAGATIIVNDAPEKSYSLEQAAVADKQVKAVAGTIWKKVPAGKLMKWKVGKGTVVQGPYKESSFEPIGIPKDLVAMDATGKPAKDITWTHRKKDSIDIYFISNQRNEERRIDVTLRVKDCLPEIWDPVTGEHSIPATFNSQNGCMIAPLQLAANGSAFIVLRKKIELAGVLPHGKDPDIRTIAINNPWTVSFDTTKGGPAQPVIFEQLKDWSTDDNNAIKYYSGTAAYTTNLDFTKAAEEKVRLNVGSVANLATVYVNGIDCGVVWTAPYQVDITKALRPGKNELRIEVTNTWFNRLKGDAALPQSARITWINAASLYPKNKPLLPAGLLGPVTLQIEHSIKN